MQALNSVAPAHVREGEEAEEESRAFPPSLFSVSFLSLGLFRSHVLLSVYL